MGIFGPKTYKITQEQLDNMLYAEAELKAENKRLRAFKENDDLLFHYEKLVIEQQDKIKELEGLNTKLIKQAKISESTMTAVFEKLDSTMKVAKNASNVVNLYKEMDKYKEEVITLSDDELPFSKKL